MATAAALRLGWVATHADRWIATRLGDELGREVRIDGVDVSFADGLGLTLRNLRVADDPAFSSEHFVHAEQAAITVALLPALIGRYRPTAIVLSRPRLQLIWDGSGFNGESLGNAQGRRLADWSFGIARAEAATDATVQGDAEATSIELRDAEVHFEDRSREPPTRLVLHGAEIRAERPSFDAPLAIRAHTALARGAERNLMIEGTIGPMRSTTRLDAVPLDLDFAFGPLTPAEARAVPALAALLPETMPLPATIAARGKLQGSGEHLTLRAESALAEAPLEIDAEIALATREIDFVTRGPSGGLETVGKLRYATEPPTLEATLKAAATEWSGVALRDVVASVAHTPAHTSVEKFSFRAFEGLWNGNARFEAGAPGSFAVHASVSGAKLASVFAGRFPDAMVDGVLDTDFSLTGSGTSRAELEKTLRGDGYVEVKDGMLKAIGIADQILKSTIGVSGVVGLIPSGLRAKYPDLFAEDGARFESFGGTFAIGDGKLASEDLTLVARDYSLSGAGSYATDGNIEFEGTFEASRTLTEDVLATFGRGSSLKNAEGRIELPIRVDGTAAELTGSLDPQFLQDLLGRLRQP